MVVYEVASGKRLSEFDVRGPMGYFSGAMPSPQRLALSPDGKELYVGDGSGKIHIYDWATGKETASFVAHDLADDPKLGQRPGVAALAFSFDGKTLYSAGNYHGCTIWDVQTRKAIAQLPQSIGPVSEFAVSPSGLKIAVADPAISARVHILDAKTGTDLVPLPGHVNMLVALSLIPNGDVLAACLDRTMRWWDLEHGRELKSQSVGGLVPWLGTSLNLADSQGIFG